MVILKIDDDKYPDNLRKISNPPKVLYVEGNIQNLKKPGIAVIGSRKCTDYGKRMCKYFTEKLIDYDINIISGMAIGIDTIAHSTAIKNLGATIAVLPSGLNNIYPKENYDLYKKIIDTGGTVVTEYEPNEKADSNKFRKRNRIVSGLAIGTLVVEGGYRSGTQITARITKKENKPVFCIPSDLDSKNGVAINNLIKRGAFLVTNEKDILDKFEHIKFIKRNISKEEKLRINRNMYNSRKVNKEFSDIYNILTNTPIDINEICNLSNLTMDEVNYKLTMLEIEGIIKEYPGRMFSKSIN